MQRSLLSASVVVLLAFTAWSPALAQETPDKKKYCADPTPTAYQYGCDEPCEPQQQYADDEAAGCVKSQYQYGPCNAGNPCSPYSEAQADNSIIQGLPPASVQNVVVDAAKSVSEDAPKASRALDTAKPVDSTRNVALAAEGEPVEEPPAYSPAAPKEPIADAVPLPPATAPAPATAPDTSAARTEPAEAARTPEETVQPAGDVQRTESTERAEAAEVNVDQDRNLEEVDGDLAAFTRNAPVDRFMLSLFALGGSTLLVGGGLLVRKIVG